MFIIITRWLQTHCLKITEKSHSTLRAKRATFTLLVDKSLKMPKMDHFGEFLKIEKPKCNIVSDFQTLWKRARVYSPSPIEELNVDLV